MKMFRPKEVGSSVVTFILVSLVFAGLPLADGLDSGIVKTEPAALLGGYDKGFFIQSQDGQFNLAIQARMQTRFTFEKSEGEPDEGTFTIARARLTLKGHAFDARTKYKFQSDFGKGRVSLKDFFVDMSLLSDDLVVRVGQWKLPFSRQLITSSGSLELVDRAITDKAFGGGRDIGIVLHNNYQRSPEFEYSLGLFNGTGIKSSLNGEVLVDMSTGEGEIVGGGFDNVPETFNPTAVARVGYNFGGIKGYKEGDLEGGPVRFAVGLSGLTDFDVDGDDVKTHREQVDAVVKLYGFAAMAAVYNSTEINALPAAEDVNTRGLHLQASMVFGGFVQPVVQYAVVAPEGVGNDVDSFLAGLSIYLMKHKVKWQTDLTSTVSEGEGGPSNDLKLRSQLQFAF